VEIRLNGEEMKKIVFALILTALVFYGISYSSGEIKASSNGYGYSDSIK
jgi:hypothetical protein